MTTVNAQFWKNYQELGAELIIAERNVDVAIAAAERARSRVRDFLEKLAFWEERAKATTSGK